MHSASKHAPQTWKDRCVLWFYFSLLFLITTFLFIVACGGLQCSWWKQSVSALVSCVVLLIFLILLTRPFFRHNCSCTCHCSACFHPSDAADYESVPVGQNQQDDFTRFCLSLTCICCGLVLLIFSQLILWSSFVYSFSDGGFMFPWSECE